MPFDARTLGELSAAEEVEIVTPRPDGSRRRTVIWVMVDGADVYVRSVNGARGYWYQSAVEPGAEVALVIDGRTIPVTVELATDEHSIETCSRLLREKYARSGSLDSMLTAPTLGTTLRLRAVEAPPA